MDVFFLVEICWCAILCAQTGMRRVLQIAGGFVASGYIATRLSPWLAHTFLGPGSAAFSWIVTQVIAPIHAEPVLGQYLPPQSTGLLQSSDQRALIATHVVHTLFFFAITTAVFLLFYGMTYLTEALWDHPQHLSSRPLVTSLERVGRILVAIACAAYVAVQSAEVLVSVAWIRQGAMLGHALDTSLWIQAVGYMNTYLLYHPVR